MWAVPGAKEIAGVSDPDHLGSGTRAPPALAIHWRPPEVEAAVGTSHLALGEAPGVHTHAAEDVLGREGKAVGQVAESLNAGIPGMAPLGNLLLQTTAPLRRWAGRVTASPQRGTMRALCPLFSHMGTTEPVGGLVLVWEEGHQCGRVPSRGPSRGGQTQDPVT